MQQVRDRPCCSRIVMGGDNYSFIFGPFRISSVKSACFVASVIAKRPLKAERSPQKHPSVTSSTVARASPCRNAARRGAKWRSKTRHRKETRRNDGRGGPNSRSNGPKSYESLPDTTYGRSGGVMCGQPVAIPPISRCTAGGCSRRTSPSCGWS